MGKVNGDHDGQKSHFHRGLDIQNYQSKKDDGTATRNWKFHVSNEYQQLEVSMNHDAQSSSFVESGTRIERIDSLGRRV